MRLYRGSAGDFTHVGTLTQFVPARPNRTVEFSFNYTFTPEDAAIGRVTFKAEAVLVNAYDALFADNTVISTSTNVR